MDTPRRLPVRRILLCLVGGYLILQLLIAFFGSKPIPSRETTYVTGPLKRDGKIDYAAALHELMSKGIKPDDNAAVLIDRAFGPGSISPGLRAQYFQWIGTDVLPEQGDYVLTQSTLMAKKLKEADASPELNEQMLKEFSRAQRQAWKQSDCPLVAEWLEANAIPLELIKQASQRSQFYSPLVTAEGLIQAETTTQNVREAARLLLSRAMFKLGQDDVDGAWSDLLACHRLASLMGRRAPTVTPYLVAIALDAVASQGDAALIDHGLTLEQAQKCLSDCDQLPAFGEMADVLDIGGRLETLDGTLQSIPIAGLDVNTMLRQANLTYDEMVTALRIKETAKRKMALIEIDKEFVKRITTARQPLRQIASYVVFTRRTLTQNVGNVLLGMLVPAYNQADTAQTRMRIRRKQVRIGFAMAVYRAVNGSYPQALDELVPKYLNELPLDPYTEKPFIYVLREKGFVELTFDFFVRREDFYVAS